ncbi:hypothetical protein GCM10010504_29300 [Streptomyces griseus]|nr:hypothetical protein GCM10010504_29300 [Streptomyces griseus]
MGALPALSLTGCTDVLPVRSILAQRPGAHAPTRTTVTPGHRFRTSRSKAGHPSGGAPTVTRDPGFPTAWTFPTAPTSRTAPGDSRGRAQAVEDRPGRHAP